MINGVIVTDKSGVARRLRVFLCHASDDKEQVLKLYKQLRKAGVEPWLDEVDLLPGQNWKAEIKKAIRRTDAVLVCLSSNSVTKIGFVQNEIKDALDIADQQPEESIFIIPTKLEACSLPERLSHVQAVDYYRRGGFQRLEKTLREKADFLNELYRSK